MISCSSRPLDHHSYIVLYGYSLRDSSPGNMISAPSRRILNSSSDDESPKAFIADHFMIGTFNY